jgi:hypothetical protein
MIPEPVRKEVEQFIDALHVKEVTVCALCNCELSAVYQTHWYFAPHVHVYGYLLCRRCDGAKEVS